MPKAPKPNPDPTPESPEQRTFEASTAEEAMDAGSDDDGHWEESSYTASDPSPTDEEDSSGTPPSQEQ